MARIENAIKDAVVAAVQDKIDSPTTTLTSVAPVTDAKAVAVAAADGLRPVVQMLTNNEPWYQSWVTNGSLAVVVSSALDIWQKIFDGATSPAQLSPSITAMIGAFIVLYGRYAARRPIGG